MEILVFFIFSAVLIIMLSKVMGTQNEILDRIRQMKEELKELKENRWEKQEVQTYVVPEPKPEIKPEVKPEVKPEHYPEPVEEEFVRVFDKPVEEREPVFAMDSFNQREEEYKERVIEAPQPTFWEKNPDLEKFIGENLINKIGIAILVLGIGFFVKYAIDKEWINEYGRVGIGFLAGGLLVGIAHKLRKAFAPFSSVLIGGGMAVMYFTITIAFHDYHIFSQTVAFVLMVIVTGFTIFLSYVYDRVELAVLAIIGGFTAPFLVSTGEGNYIVLFTYLLILNVGMLALAYLKKWNIVNIVAYVFTIVLYGGWLSTKVVGVPDAPYGGALLFATLFYLIFFLMNIVNNVKEKRKFNGLEISMILSNTFLYFSAGLVILHNIDKGLYQGLFTALIAVFNFIFVMFLFKKSDTDKNLVYLLIGLVLTFISLAAPIQLEGNYITLFWALESVLLLWLAQKSGIQLMKASSVVILGLMIISLVMDWNYIYGIDKLPFMMIVFNKGFITGFVAVSALVGNLLLLKNEEDKYLLWEVEKKSYQILVSFLLVAVLYVVLLLEVSYQSNIYVENVHLIYLIIGLYNYLYLIGLDLFALRKDSKLMKGIAAVLSGVGLLGYLLFYQIQISSLRDGYLEMKAGFAAFLFHYLVVSALIVVALMFLKLVKEFFEEDNIFRRSYIWFFAFLVVFIGSAELTNATVIGGERNIIGLGERLSSIRRIGFPILWGVCSFVFMFLGMKWKNKDLRIISLTLFGITLIKLFVFDLRNLSEGGKIASFIILGILLLVVSFMYQRLKKLIVEEETRI